MQNQRQAANAVCAMLAAIGGDYVASDVGGDGRVVDAQHVQADVALAAAMRMVVGVEDNSEGPGWAVTVRTPKGVLYARYMHIA